MCMVSLSTMEFTTMDNADSYVLLSMLEWNLIYASSCLRRLRATASESHLKRENLSHKLSRLSDQRLPPSAELEARRA